jgi:hypothetical protein
MSELPNFPPPPPPPQPPGVRFVTFTTMIVVVLMTAMLVGGVVLAIVFLLGPQGGAPFRGGRDDGPYVQKETVNPTDHRAGEVTYPIPYASKPHLTLSSSSKRKYLITKQSETGFEWSAGDLDDDFIPDGAGGRKKKPEITYEPFTWETKGVRAGSDAVAGVLFEQKGRFQTLIGQTGQVNFPFPYQSPPNVELTGRTNTTTVTECTATGFKWTNTGKEEFGNTGEVEWHAKGIKAQPK